eukprot:gene35342-42826_t
MLDNISKPPLLASIAVCSALLSPCLSIADDLAVVQQGGVEKVALYNKKSTDLQSYVDINRGFRMLRPYGFNEFDGNGSGYLVKFSSLFDVDENVVVGGSSSAQTRSSIADYGDPQALGQKLADKRRGSLVSARARETDGVLFFDFEFRSPLDPALPRPGSKARKPAQLVELYSLCVHRGQLWSVQATSNDVLFPQHERTLRGCVLSFFPQL